MGDIEEDVVFIGSSILEVRNLVEEVLYIRISD